MCSTILTNASIVHIYTSGKKRYKKEKQKKQTFRMCTMHTIYFIQNVLFCAVYDCGRQAGNGYGYGYIDIKPSQENVCAHTANDQEKTT